MQSSAFYNNSIHISSDHDVYAALLKVKTKHILNRMLAIVLLIALFPILLLISVFIKMESKGPVLFKQRRGGMNNKEFIVFKFRTMKVCEDGDVIRQASVNDNRVTRVGAILRRYSLDELPQLINVVKSEMSLIGPRPHAVAHNDYFGQHIRDYRLRHVLRPGMTGWAQVNGLRGETDTLEKMEKRLKYDLYYIRNRTLAFDIKILLMTAAVIFRKENAY